jgi:hypothetical protein
MTCDRQSLLAHQYTYFFGFAVLCTFLVESNAHPAGPLIPHHLSAKLPIPRKVTHEYETEAPSLPAALRYSCVCLPHAWSNGHG